MLQKQREIMRREGSIRHIRATIGAVVLLHQISEISVSKFIWKMELCIKKHDIKV